MNIEVLIGCFVFAHKATDQCLTFREMCRSFACNYSKNVWFHHLFDPKFSEFLWADII